MNTTDNKLGARAVARPSAAGPGGRWREDGTGRLGLALACVVALAWVYLLAGAGMSMAEMDMGGSEMVGMPPDWTLGYALRVLLMWTVMMVAMMLPSAMPAILRLTGDAVRQPDAAPGIGLGLSFAAGYVLVWTGFGAAATVLQALLDRAHLLSDAMAVVSPLLAALVIAAIGVYQLTPLKQRSLGRCHAAVTKGGHGPLRRSDQALRQGVQHGLACLGCCGAAMGLLFVGGVMNLIWIAAITLWLFAEKTLRGGGALTRLAAGALIAWAGASAALAFS